MRDRELPFFLMDITSFPFRQEPFGISKTIMLSIFISFAPTPSSKENDWIMGKIEIDQERCKGCGLCTISCPKHLINTGKEMNSLGFFWAVCEDNEACTGCALCGEICPDVAIRVWR